MWLGSMILILPPADCCQRCLYRCRLCRCTGRKVIALPDFCFFTCSVSTTVSDAPPFFVTQILEQPRHIRGAEWRPAGVGGSSPAANAADAGSTVHFSDECVRQVPAPCLTPCFLPRLSPHNPFPLVSSLFASLTRCRCMQTNNDNFQACSFYFDMMKQCKASAGQN